MSKRCLSLSLKSPLQAVRNSFLHAAATYPVNLNRVYTVGYSGGCRGRVRHDEKFTTVRLRPCAPLQDHSLTTVTLPRERGSYQPHQSVSQVRIGFTSSGFHSLAQLTMPLPSRRR